MRGGFVGLVGCVLVLAGCSAAGEGDAAPDVDDCALTFTAGADLLDEVTAAASEWSVATGRNICVAPGGVAFELKSEVLVFGQGACGLTLKNGRGLVTEPIQISTDPARCNVAHVVRHEMGHALAGQEHGHTESGESGLMALKCNTDLGIDGAALDLICSGLSCV